MWNEKLGKKKKKINERKWIFAKMSNGRLLTHGEDENSDRRMTVFVHVWALISMCHNIFGRAFSIGAQLGMPVREEVVFRHWLSWSGSLPSTANLYSSTID